MSDGTIAIFHARDYSLEWLTPQGRTRTPSLPYPWIPITDAERAQIVDSVNAARRHVYDSAMAKRAADSLRTAGASSGVTASTTAGGAAIMGWTAPPQIVLATLADVPNRRPPTPYLALMADADNRVWIRSAPLRPEPAGIEWYIVDRSGQLVDRVRTPAGARIAGFGRGLVYVVQPDGARWRLAALSTR
jgi:hypothetical protein